MTNDRTLLAMSNEIDTFRCDDSSGEGVAAIGADALASLSPPRDLTRTANGATVPR